jgi:hypothetical protein
MNDLISNPNVPAAIYFTNHGDYILKFKNGLKDNEIVTKSLRAPEVAAAFTRETVDSGWIASGIMRVGSGHKGPWFVFFKPACKVKIQIGTAKRIEIPIPSTVLVGIDNEYRLFAVSGKQFDAQAKVYRAPFPNVYGEGRICWGKNTKPKVSMDWAMVAWNLFFEAPFNGDLAAGKSKINNYKDDIRKQLKSLAGLENYPMNDLVQYRSTLNELVKELVKVKE